MRGRAGGSLTAILVAVAAVLGTAQAAHASPPHGLPGDAPAALYRAEPALPKANGWPASNTAFSRTSGTGRLADGAFYWTDFLYDDHGTTTASAGNPAVTAGTPSLGTYIYPIGPADNNGADIFRAAVARRAHATYWRVDWQTMFDPTIPIAEWTFDRDDNAATGGSAWPAHAGVHSPGIDTALVVSSRGAELIKATTGVVLAYLHTAVTRASHSFVVKVPNRLLHPTRSWRIRLAAGLASPGGRNFTRAPNAAPGQTRVYNITFRKRTQEHPSDNFWDDNAQTTALLTRNASPFSHVVHWSQLRRRVSTPQPLPRGWSDRWYGSDIAPGQGVVVGPESTADGFANFLNRVQPYAVYVPRSYRPHAKATALTFLLHSSNQNHNQYAATTPRFVQLACADRHSICVSPLGRGPDGNYFDSAELDFWQVWHQVALAYHLSPNHTVLSGYSMGGIGSNQLAIEHPDLFARSVTLAGGVGNIDSLGNLRWVPTYLAGGAEDELVPVTLEAGEADALKALGDRFRWIVVSAIDHVSYELADSFADAVQYMGRNPMHPATRVRRPGRISFTWTPANTPPPDGTSVAATAGIGWTQLPRLGVGTTGAYWLRHLRARSAKHDARIVAVSGERPDRQVTAHSSQDLDAGFQPEPAVVTSQRWSLGPRPAAKPTLRLTLTNVRAATVLLGMAGLTGKAIRLVVISDGRASIHLGERTIHVTKGRHVVRFRA